MARHRDATSMSWMVKLSMTTRLANLIPAFGLNRLYDFSHLDDTQRSREVLSLRDLGDTHWSRGLVQPAGDNEELLDDFEAVVALVSFGRSDIVKKSRTHQVAKNLPGLPSIEPNKFTPLAPLTGVPMAPA